jgi:hypothetical protein
MKKNHQLPIAKDVGHPQITIYDPKASYRQSRSLLLGASSDKKDKEIPFSKAKLHWIKRMEDSLIGDGQLNLHANPWAWRSYHIL